MDYQIGGLCDFIKIDISKFIVYTQIDVAINKLVEYKLNFVVCYMK